MVTYSKVSLPGKVEIQLRPLPDQNCEHGILRFVFGGEPTAPPPPGPTSEMAEDTADSRQANTTMQNVSSSASSTSSSSSSGMSVSSRTSFNDHAYFATELAAPWRVMSCNKRW